MEEVYPEAVRVSERSAYDIQTPEIVGMGLRVDAARRFGQSYTIPEDYVAIIERALVCLRHNAVMSQTQDVVRESSNAGSPRFFPQRRLERRQGIRISGTATLLQARFHNYYHFLIDELPRLAALNQHACLDTSEIKLICSKSVSDAEAFFLDKIGLSTDRIVSLDEEPLYRVDRLVFTPFKTRLQAGYLPPEYVSHLREALLPKRARKHTRLFISREEASERTVANRSEVVELLADFGFIETILEGMSPQEQIEALYDAEAIVGVHGAGLANMLFSPPGLKVAEIFPTHYVIPHYYFLSKSLGHEYSYQCEGGDSRSVETFRVDIGRLEASLERLDISRN